MAWFLVTFEEAKREAKIELEKITQQAEQPESFQDSNQYDMNEHSRQGTVEPRTIFFMSMLIFNSISILSTQCCCKFRGSKKHLS